MGLTTIGDGLYSGGGCRYILFLCADWFLLLLLTGWLNWHTFHECRVVVAMVEVVEEESNEERGQAARIRTK